MTVEPTWGLWLALLALGTVLAMVGTVAVRRLVPLEHLRRNNEVAGFKFATVGVLYAVLLAFAVLVVWEKDNDAEASVAAEAGSAAALYRLSSEVRWDWEHSIAPMKERRWSVTFRSLR